MNQLIRIRYKPEQHPNHWIIWFCLKNKEHREKVPSWLKSDGYWDWFVHNEHQNSGKDFDWNKS